MSNNNEMDISNIYNTPIVFAESLKHSFYEFWVKGMAGMAERENRGISNIHHSKGHTRQTPLHDYTH